MAQAAVYEAKKALRRELKKRISAMTNETKEKESRVIAEKVLVVLSCVLGVWVKAGVCLCAIITKSWPFNQSGFISGVTPSK